MDNRRESEDPAHRSDKNTCTNQRQAGIVRKPDHTIYPLIVFDKLFIIRPRFFTRSGGFAFLEDTIFRAFPGRFFRLVHFRPLVQASVCAYKIKCPLIQIT